jgi:hypothetical protein
MGDRLGSTVSNHIAHAGASKNDKVAKLVALHFRVHDPKIVRKLAPGAGLAKTRAR